ncbi:MAG: hypothetical protein RLZZ618_4093 [Pseudomonadota bacterium]|jgi:poly(hydroxyalkanoate) depolymerase family esterase
MTLALPLSIGSMLSLSHRMLSERMRGLVFSFVLLLAALLASPVAQAGTTDSFTFKAQGHEGSRDREVKVYVPSGLSGKLPMVMALHGCRQTHDDVLRDWGLKAAADRHGFILVTPLITSYSGLRNKNCWGFWLDGERHRGRGENEDLVRIAMEVETRHAVDEKRRYITGLSSGGAMAVVEAVTHNDYWAASAAAAGLPYGEDAVSVSFTGCPGSATFHTLSRVVSDMRSERANPYPIPLMVLNNNADCTVLKAASALVRDAHLQVFGSSGHDTPATARAKASPCTPVFVQAHGCQHTVYTIDGSGGARSVVETVFYDGPIPTSFADDTDHGHYWVGGQHGREGPWAVQAGPSYPDIIWSFFSRHPRTGTGTGPTGHVACVQVKASPVLHLAEGRAVPGGWFGWRAQASGDRIDIGSSFTSWTSVALTKPQGGPGWFTTKPPGCL